MMKTFSQVKTTEKCKCIGRNWIYWKENSGGKNMGVYDEIRDNMSTINNANHNHNYKYYMRVFDSSDTFVSDYIDIEIEDFL